MEGVGKDRCSTEFLQMLKMVNQYFLYVIKLIPIQYILHIYTYIEMLFAVFAGHGSHRGTLAPGHGPGRRKRNVRHKPPTRTGEGT